MAGDFQQVFHQLAARWFLAVSELECLEGQRRCTAERQAIASAMYSARQLNTDKDERPFNWDRVSDRDFWNMVRKVING